MFTKSEKRWSLAGHVMMSVLSVLAVAPFLLLVIASFTEENAAIRNGYTFFPEEWSLEAYRYIFGQWATIGRSYLVTIGITVIGTVIGVSIMAMIGYTMSRKNLPGRSLILFLLTFAMLFRGGLTATYIVYTQVLHIKDTLFGLLLPHLLVNIYNIMMFRNYFENTIPPALQEAAYIDGASEMKTFTKVALPLSLPMVATVAMMQALAYWNDWMNGLYYLSNNSPLQSIQTLLNKMNENIKFLQQNNIGTDMVSGSLPSTTVRMAIAVVGILPVLCMYPFFQKWFVKGAVSGAVKE